MHIEHELKLDFKDVLIRPKRSTLTSRSNVDIARQFTFRHGKDAYDGIPIIAANMDSTGTFDMARALQPLGLSVACTSTMRSRSMPPTSTGSNASQPPSIPSASPGPTRRSSTR
jgi:hypothetical protein